MRTWAEITGKDRSSYDECPSCAGPKAKHARECQACSRSIMRGENHSAWKGDDARATSKRTRVSNPKRGGPCDECGDPGRDRHHKDGDPGNNVPENIAWLCRRCHMQADGRLHTRRSDGTFATIHPVPYEKAL